MEKTDMKTLQEQLNESAKSLLFGSIAILAVVFAGTLIGKTFILPIWLFMLVVYIAPWILALIEISLIIRVIKIKRAMKNS